MKAVIVDLQEHRAAALCEDGSIREIPDAGYVPGQSIELPDIEISIADGTSDEKMPSAEKTSPGIRGGKHRGARPRFGQIAAAAAACFLALGIGAGTVWAMPYGKVYMESGSSLSYTINRFDYVLQVDADDEVGQEILEKLDLTRIVHKKIDRAVEQTLEQMDENREKNADQYAETAPENADADKAAETLSRPVEDGKIEIVTEIKNEKHAKKLKERLTKIAEKAVGTSPSPDQSSEPTQDAAQNPDEIPADGQTPEDQKELPDAAAQNSGAEEESKENSSSEKPSDNDLSGKEDSDPNAPAFSEKTPETGTESDSGSKILDRTSDDAPAQSPGQPPAGTPDFDGGGERNGSGNDGGNAPGGHF